MLWKLGGGVQGLTAVNSVSGVKGSWMGEAVILSYSVDYSENENEHLI